MKGLKDDACDNATFEEDPSPACVWAWFMISSSSFFTRTLNFHYWFWLYNLLNKFIKSLFFKWAYKIFIIRHIYHLNRTNGHKGACVSNPYCCWCIAANIPERLWLIKLTSRQVPTTCAFTRSIKQYQLSVFSFLMNANAEGNIWWFLPIPTAVSIWPLYYSIRNVSSIQITQR
jgi:hypothetical protein